MSSILEKLVFLLQLDASGLKKGADDTQQATKKIDHALDTTAHHANHLSHSFHHLKRELASFAVSFLSVGAFIEGVKSSFEYASKVSEASDALKVNVEQLDAWDNAIVKAGGTAEGFQQSLKDVAKHFGTTNEVALRVLPRIASAFEHMGARRSTEYGKLIGLDEATIALLQKGRREVDAIIARQKELGVITKQDKEIVSKFNEAWQQTAHQFRKVSFIAEDVILPVLTTIINKFGEVASSLKEHKDFIVGALIAIGSAALYAGSEFLIPLAVIGAISAAFGVLYEDIVAFNKGQSSLIGDMIKKWPLLGKVIHTSSEAIKLWLQAVKAYFKGLSYVFEHVFSIFEKISSKVSGLTKKIGDFAHKHFIHHKQSVEVAHKAIQEASSSKLTSQNSASIANSSGFGVLKPSIINHNNVSIGDINVQTQAATGEGTARDILNTLEDHLFHANSYFDDGRAL